MTRPLLTVLVTVGLLSVASAAFAQRVIVFEEEHIEGEIEKPEAFYILSPSNLEYEPSPPEATFLDALYDTLETQPL